MVINTSGSVGKTLDDTCLNPSMVAGVEIEIEICMGWSFLYTEMINP